MNDRDPLSKLLQAWRHDPPPAPGFSDAVWTRIHTSPAKSAPSAKLLHFPVPLPLAAGFAVLLAALAGTGAALALNHRQNADLMASAYVRTIDPLQMTSMPASSSHS